MKFTDDMDETDNALRDKQMVMDDEMSNGQGINDRNSPPLDRENEQITIKIITKHEQ